MINTIKDVEPNMRCYFLICSMYDVIAPFFSYAVAVPHRETVCSHAGSGDYGSVIEGNITVHYYASVGDRGGDGRTRSVLLVFISYRIALRHENNK